MDQQIVSFREKLEREHTFPGPYMFKFIVPSGRVQEVEELLPAGEISFRQSANNTYTSVTLQKIVASSEEIIEVYLAMKHIEGVIAL